MKKIVLPPELLKKLQEIYRKLEEEYDRVAGELVFSCRDCPDNCCDSYFLHHTYVEWAYLWMGLQKLEPESLAEIEMKAGEYIRCCAEAEARGERPQVMCPLNREGLCILYEHRMLVCRTHGVPARIRRPDGRVLHFPGCFHCQNIVEKIDTKTGDLSVDRTPMLHRLAQLEGELLDRRRHLLPKVKLTIAQMIIKGPPTIPSLFCERKNPAKSG
ncbi:hypothetical protein DGMP_33970 [Desulfomarina profundi]|uniref:YkgJ family cysteine cluster protein n=1 Tax=Desulfomarina profundi TaxID=2772557 RepID=A0A8D5JIH7_9BACT|nr:hypothetical protein [Desulfomarina profundi]BCL62704.1 hypothetical protein DGMP_33970 [Desulfomarina profundi]